MPASSAKSPVNILNDFNKKKIYPKPMPAFIRLIYAIVSEDHDPVTSVKSIEKIRKTFIDWNECRVSRWVEIARAMDPLPGSDKVAMRIKDMLNRLFDRKGILALDFCAEMKVTEARKFINELDLNLPKQEVGFILFHYHSGMTVPVTVEGLGVAKKYGLIPKNGDKPHLQKVFSKMEHQEAVDLLHYLELEAIIGDGSESDSSKKVGKKISKKKTRKKV